MALKRCKAAFAADVKGRPYVVKVGDLVDESDPLYKGRELNFEDVTATAGKPAVEQATAAPNERRRVGRPPKSHDTDKEG